MFMKIASADKNDIYPPCSAWRAHESESHTRCRRTGPKGCQQKSLENKSNPDAMNAHTHTTPPMVGGLQGWSRRRSSVSNNVYKMYRRRSWRRSSAASECPEPAKVSCEMPFKDEESTKK